MHKSQDSPTKNKKIQVRLQTNCKPQAPSKKTRTGRKKQAAAYQGGVGGFFASRRQHWKDNSGKKKKGGHKRGSQGFEKETEEKTIQSAKNQQSGQEQARARRKCS